MRRIFGVALAVGVLALSAASSWADDEAPGGKGKGKGKGGFKGDPEMMFKRIDANGDGKISKDEFKAFFSKIGKGKLADKPELIDKMFQRMDANGDGSISLEEFKKAREMREKKAEGKGKPGKKKGDNND